MAPFIPSRTRILLYDPCKGEKLLRKWFLCGLAHILFGALQMLNTTDSCIAVCQGIENDWLKPGNVDFNLDWCYTFLFSWDNDLLILHGILMSYRAICCDQPIF